MDKYIEDETQDNLEKNSQRQLHRNGMLGWLVVMLVMGVTFPVYFPSYLLTAWAAFGFPGIKFLRQAFLYFETFVHTESE